MNTEIRNKIWEGKPHFLGFAGYYILLIYESFLLVILFPPLFNNSSVGNAPALIYKQFNSNLTWNTAVLIPLLILTFKRIEVRWLGISFLYILCGILFYKLNVAKPILINHIIFLLVGLFVLEIYRRGFRYYITKNSLVIIYRGIKSYRRDVFLSKISDIVIEQGIFNKICNIGNIIPISNSGFGLGVNSVFGAAGVSLSPLKRIGGNAILGKISGRLDPQTKNKFMFYKIKDPNKVLGFIISR